MKRLVLLRGLRNAEGVSGKLYGYDFSCATLERPWKDNKPSESCIPAGEYICRPSVTGKHQWYEVEHVEGRSGIEFHTGNSVHDSEGCILVGNAVLNHTGWRLYGSMEAAKRMKIYIGNEKFTLTIIEL